MKAISLLVVLALSASLVHGQVPTGSLIPQNPEADSDAPGTIDGKKTPHLISDSTAYKVFLRSMADRPGAWDRTARIDSMQESGLGEARILHVIEAGNLYLSALAPVDKAALEVIDRTWPRPDAAARAQIEDFQNQKERIVTSSVQMLAQKLGTADFAKLQKFLREVVKSRVKVTPSRIPPIHH
jgi:hypothetical protein